MKDYKLNNHELKKIARGAADPKTVGGWILLSFLLCIPILFTFEAGNWIAHWALHSKRPNHIVIR